MLFDLLATAGLLHSVLAFQAASYRQRQDPTGLLDACRLVLYAVRLLAFRQTI